MAPACRRPARYTLYGVLYHHGVSAGGGHYTLDVLHPNPRGGTGSAGVAGSSSGGSGEAWLHIDDETVSAVRHEDVFGSDNGKERSDDRCAYLLFYRRAALTRT
jgi:ubiquitin carboxyl-terminal hydrolase 10